MKRLWNATHENTGAAGKGEARGGEIVAVAEWKSGREVERSVSPHEASPGPDDDGPGRCDGATAPRISVLLHPATPFLPLPPPPSSAPPAPPTSAPLRPRSIQSPSVRPLYSPT